MAVIPPAPMVHSKIKCNTTPDEPVEMPPNREPVAVRSLGLKGYLLPNPKITSSRCLTVASDFSMDVFILPLLWYELGMTNELQPTGFTYLMLIVIPSGEPPCPGTALV